MRLQHEVCPLYTCRRVSCPTARWSSHRTTLTTCSSRSDSGASGLLQAARDGDYEGAKRSLKSSVFRRGEDVNVRDDRECSPLHYAVKISHARLVRLLLDKGADLQAEDKHGWSVLHYAVRYGDLDTCHQLVERGADIHCREKRGWTVSQRLAFP